jgi:hypothetical protein
MAMGDSAQIKTRVEAFLEIIVKVKSPNPSGNFLIFNQNK